MNTEKPVETHLPASRKAESTHTDRFAAIEKASQSVLRASEELPDDVIGTSAFLATKNLSDDWIAAMQARHEKLSVSSMASDIDGVIDLLTKLKIGLSLEPGAEEKMRKALGLASEHYPKAP